jgi:hypothetical protein
VGDIHDGLLLTYRVINDQGSNMGRGSCIFMGVVHVGCSVLFVWQ